jgi:hypothetical protein
VLKVLGIEYARFVMEHNGRPPSDKEQLADFLIQRKHLIPGLNDVAQLFVSPRDNAPLLVYYGKSMPPADDSGFPVIAREALGADGVCFVTNTRGAVREIAIDELPVHLAGSN